MAKRSMKDQLRTTTKAEIDHVKQRFRLADEVLQTEAPTKHPVPDFVPSVRDTFIFPPDEHESISRVQKRCLARGANPSKSEIIRAGLAALKAMTDADLVALVQRLPKIRTGRPPSKTS